MRSIVVTLSTLAVCASALTSSRPKVLFRRQACLSGEKECGLYCIPTSYTCCPDRGGGCPPTEYCGLADNGVYGCCPNGETCSGSVTDTDTLFDTVTDTFTPSFTTSARATATPTSGSGVCDVGWTECGDGCIPEGWDCCADGSGGCDPTIAQCFLGSDGKYGCCPDIYTTCTGPAGDPTTIPSDFTETEGPVSTTSRAIATTSARLTTTAAGSSVTAVGTRSISSHSTAVQTSVSVQSAAAEAPQATILNPFAALFSALLAAAAFLVG